MHIIVRQRERDIDRNQKRVKGRPLSRGQPTLWGILIYVCSPLYIEKGLLTAISFHVPVPRVCVLTGGMSPRHKHVACCELGDKHISELHPRAWWLLPQRPWQLARHTATNPQTDPPIKYHLYNTKHTSVLSEIKKTDGWNCIILQQTVTNLIPF